MTVNLAVVGLGAFGQKHLDALAQIPDAVIHSVAHSKMDVAQEVAAKYGAAHAFTDYTALLAQPDLDGVLLATRAAAAGNVAVVNGDQAILRFLIPSNGGFSGAANQVFTSPTSTP